MVALELEVLAKEFDRFGWDRDRGSAAHDRLVTDWMDALQDYPLSEIKQACADAVIDEPTRMPNRGVIVNRIMENRRLAMAARSRTIENHRRSAGVDEEPRGPRVTKEQTDAIIKEVGFAQRKL